jgi:WD40 repeat protein/transcriptional regulator with XRE-family HTH domain
MAIDSTLTFGALLKLFRRRVVGLTQSALAEKSGYDTNYISMMERGLRVPTGSTAELLANALGLTAQERDQFVAAAIRQRSLSSLSAPISQELYREDWGDAPHTRGFHGRVKELAELKHWVVDDHCQVVAILGMGGIGKTSLAVVLADQVKGAFARVFWRSLQNAPPLKSFLQSCVQFLSDQRPDDLEDIDSYISMLITCLRKHRCLLVLDNMESVLQGHERAGQYREGYEDYGKLIRVVGELEHQSCLLLTSREKPQDLAHLEGTVSLVRSLPLAGVGPSEGQQILRDKGLSGSDQAWAELVRLYSGNPLMLKLASEEIRELFEGDIGAFLQTGSTISGDVQNLLSQQFYRLSKTEQEIMYWLAIEREVVVLNDLLEVSLPILSQGELQRTLHSLRRRSMIETHGTGRFTLQPVIMEYVTDKLIKQMYEEIDSGKIGVLGSHALIKTQAKDYIRDSQVRLILTPIVERLLTTLGKERTEEKLKRLLSQLRLTHLRVPSYAPGNVINLLIHVPSDLRGYDFSHLIVRQAYLRGVILRDVNFAHANLATSVFTDTFGSVLSVAFSPLGKLLAAGTTTREVGLWLVASGTLLLVCQGYPDWVKSLAFSPDGGLLAGGSHDRTVYLWEVSTGQILRTLQGHTDRVQTVSFSPDGSLLVSGSEDRTIRLWEVSTGQALRTLQGHTGRVSTVAFSPDGSLFASGSDDQTIRLWEVGTGQAFRTLQGHTSRVQTVAFSPDGSLLVSGSEDRTIRLWEVGTGQTFRTLQGHTDQVQTVAFSPDGSLLASGSDDQTIRLWKVSTGRRLRTLQGHTSRVQTVAFSPDGSLLASGSDDQTLRFWEVSTRQCLRTLRAYANQLQTVAFSPDGSLLASGGHDQTIRLWEVSTGQCLRTLQGHTNRLRSVAFSPDGSLLASGGEDRTIRFWEVSTGQCLRTLQGHTDRILSIIFCHNGSLLASGGDDQTIRLWEVSTGECLRTLQGHTNSIWSVASNSDGSLLASGSNDQTIRLWEVSTGESLRILQGHTGRVYAVALSRDGSLLASGSEDRTIRLWEVSTGECLHTLQGHTGVTRSISFKPDGSLLASGSHDETIKIWHVQTGECLKTLRSERPYEHMNITNVEGLSEAQKAALKVLGAIEDVG